MQIQASSNRLRYTALIVSTILMVFCAAVRAGPIVEEPIPFNGNAEMKKSIFVFLDGTRNTPDSRTNVRRLYELVKEAGDRQMTALYVQGVGTDYRHVSGAVLGRGMEDRILRAYRFISDNYSAGDNILIFGFSRGAHQARALAGILSYAGVPRAHGRSTDATHKIIEFLKRQVEADYDALWESWSPGSKPILARNLKKKYQIEVIAVEISFLGLWDTVPGSSFKDYEGCKERRGAAKKSLWWLPGIDKGERYKSGSYPPIREIAHAVAMDEKRSKFSPLLVCEAMAPKYTSVTEVWFPGAHSDVGGGYGDDGLPNISLEWMINQFRDTYLVPNVESIIGEATGVAHWSICDSPGNLGSFCKDRLPCNCAENRPSDAECPEMHSSDAECPELHPSVQERMANGSNLILWSGGAQPLQRPYPIWCPSNCDEP